RGRAGGAGDDIYFIDNKEDSISELYRHGRDLVKTSVSYALGAYVEALELTGSLSIDGTGNAQANTITGNEGANVLQGAAGADRLDGRGGADQLAGGEGRDVLTGGDGADRFVFEQDGGIDHITDFTSGSDHIQIAGSLVDKLGTQTSLLSGAFYAADGAVAGHDADDRLIYNTSTGALYYDIDGSGATAAVQIAVLDKVAGLVPLLALADFIFA
ncbi:MAG: hypothetical protein WCO04_01395, partial [Pseudomonadota bacterium]